MSGTVAALYRHPVKGFTPERLGVADLVAGAYFPCDRLYAIEDGPSGFDPAAPVFVSKTAFTVLARIARVAEVRTAYDEASSTFTVQAAGRAPLSACLEQEKGRLALAAWLQDMLGEEARGPLKVVAAPGHRFTDHPQGFVSIVNLASIRELERGAGRPLDPLRFRANLYVDGWPAWAENAAVGRTLEIGGARLEVFKPIVRCAAIDVDPATAARDTDLCRDLFDHFGHVFSGVYASVTAGRRVAEGDRARL